MAQSQVDEAIDRVWTTFGRSEGLLVDLAADAVWVRAHQGEFFACLPRLLELWTLNQLGVAVGGHELLAEVSNAWGELTAPQARSVEYLADTVWEKALTTYPSQPTSDVLLGELIYLDLPMIRWLERWLNSLDGPASQHLADAVLRPSLTSAWQARPDERQQLIGWAASEPVVMGLTLVGGVHLAQGDLTELFDQLIQTESS